MSEPKSTPDRTRELLDDMGNLRHMLGIASNVRKSEYGWRNYYCANAGDASMTRLADLGLIEKYRITGDQEYWRATEAGCNAVGLTPKQTQRALSGD